MYNCYKCHYKLFKKKKLVLKINKLIINFNLWWYHVDGPEVHIIIIIKIIITKFFSKTLFWYHSYSTKEHTNDIKIAYR